MNSNRIWYLIAGVAVAAVLALGWFLGAAPQLQQADAADQQRAQAEAQNASQRALLAQMKGQYDHLSDLKAQLASLQLSVPGEASLDDFFDQLSEMAQASGATIQSVTASEATLYGASSADPSKAAAASAPAPAASPSPSPSGSGTSVPASPVTPAVATAGTPKTPTGDLSQNLYTIPISITVASAPDQVIAFIAALQSGQRLFLVNGLSFFDTPPSGTISGYLFVVHDPSTGTAGALPSSRLAKAPTASPSPTPTPTPSATSTATPTPTPTASAKR